MNTVKLCLIYSLTVCGLSQGVYAIEEINNEKDKRTIAPNVLLPSTVAISTIEEIMDQNVSPLTTVLATELAYSVIPSAYTSYFTRANLQNVRNTMTDYLGRFKRTSIHIGYLFFQGLTASLQGMDQALEAATEGARAMSQVCQAGAKFCLAASQSWVGTGNVFGTLDQACETLTDKAAGITQWLKEVDQPYLSELGNKDSTTNGGVEVAAKIKE